MSVSASAENLSTDQHEIEGPSMCLELALEGERLCKTGDCRAGVAFFQAAIQAGTDDLRTLSAIYSQLGNAYFYLGDYTKAMEYHKLDLTLARSMSDKLGEAKSSGNLGNTFKVMGRFDEAAICCERHLTLARQLGDRLSEGRALYNLGNVYHAKGKHMGQSDTGDFSQNVKTVLTIAIRYYQQNLMLMKEIGDRGAQGRAYGNLGNTFYLLGNFEAAIENHQERLKIAKEFGDKPAERRANSNLGNSYIFLGQFEDAVTHYKQTLALAVELGEVAVEAQACYSLGNTFTLLRDFSTAIEFHLRHLEIARELCDRVGEARACWSLGNVNSAIGNHEKALHFAEQHYVLAKEIGDQVGMSTARVNIVDLRQILGLAKFTEEIPPPDKQTVSTNSLNYVSDCRIIRVRRLSMEHLDLFKLSPDKDRVKTDVKDHLKLKGSNDNKPNEDEFFEMLSRCQSKRMDDQRCSVKVLGSEGNDKSIPCGNILDTTSGTNLSNKTLMDVVNASKTERFETQKEILPGFITERGIDNIVSSTVEKSTPDEAFIDMLLRCQGSRLEEQRSELPRSITTIDTETEEVPRNSSNVGATVPDEDFLSLIMRVQGGRMEDQRAVGPMLNRMQTTNFCNIKTAHRKSATIFK